MNLKSFNWFDHNKRIMSYDLDICILRLHTNVAEKDLLDFNRYLIVNDRKVLKLDKCGYEII